LATRWQDAVQAKAREVAAAEIAARNREDRPAGATTTENPAAGSNADGALEAANRLRRERARLLERYGIVIAAWSAKGGEAEDHERYLQAVGDLQVDVFDARATWIAARDWILSPDGGLSMILAVARFLAIMAVFTFLSRLVGRGATRLTAGNPRISGLLASFIVMASRRGILAIGFLAGLSALGINIGPLLAMIGAAGFVVGFALQGTLSNFASGIMILAYRPFDVGDIIDAGGVSGKVASMNLVSTNILTFDNKSVVVPNNSIWGDVITNATGTSERRVDMSFGISYADDIDKAEAVLARIIAEDPRVLATPAPVIRLHELADSSVNFIARPWVKTADYWDVYWNVTKRVKEEFDREGISIPFPQRDVHLHGAGAR
jgi:small conductance mechanosensitive channel